MLRLATWQIESACGNEHIWYVCLCNSGYSSYIMVLQKLCYYLWRNFCIWWVTHLRGSGLTLNVSKLIYISVYADSNRFAILAGLLQFRHHFITKKLPVTANLTTFNHKWIADSFSPILLSLDTPKLLLDNNWLRVVAVLVPIWETTI